MYSVIWVTYIFAIFSLMSNIYSAPASYLSKFQSSRSSTFVQDVYPEIESMLRNDFILFLHQQIICARPVAFMVSTIEFQQE